MRGLRRRVFFFVGPLKPWKLSSSFFPPLNPIWGRRINADAGKSFWEKDESTDLMIKLKEIEKKGTCLEIEANNPVLFEAGIKWNKNVDYNE